jgi:hypothetical protein
MSEAAQPVYVSDQVREVERLHRDLLTDRFRQLPIRDQLDGQAHRIIEGHKAGNRAVVMHITCWHPQLVCHTADDIMNSTFTLDDARQTIAREYGFADWSDVEARGANPLTRTSSWPWTLYSVAMSRDCVACSPAIHR